VESQEDVGSVFSFALPVPALQAPALHPRVVRPVEVPRSEQPRPILLVESDARLADLVQRHIAPHKVILVKHTRTLARAVRMHRPKAIVYNVRPGEHAAVDTFAAGSVPVVECSLPSAAWVINDLAVVGYLNKPITRDGLVREIRRVGDVHRVLVIDDERGFCQLVERILSSDPAIQEVRAAYGGKKGLQAARRHRPDVVLLDLMMPDMDGLQVLERMRRNPDLAALPVILLTVTSYIEDQIAGVGGEVVVRHRGGIGPADTLRYLGMLLPLMEPHYDDQTALEDARTLSDTHRRSRP
jgi:CheY-like chemotaxis protein